MLPSLPSSGCHRRPCRPRPLCRQGRTPHRPDRRCAAARRHGGTPPVGATPEAAKMVGLNRLGPEAEPAAGPEDGTAPALLTDAVRTGAVPAVDPAGAPDPPPAVGGATALTAANSVFGVANAARLGPVGIAASQVWAQAPRHPGPQYRRPPNSRSNGRGDHRPLLAIVTARFLSQKGPLERSTGFSRYQSEQHIYHFP